MYKYTIASIEENNFQYHGEYNNIEEALSKIKYLEAINANMIYILIGKSA